MKAECVHCKKTEDCRPYGKGGASICFDCMMDGRETEARSEFSSQLEEAGPLGTLTDVGPIAGVQKPKATP